MDGKEFPKSRKITNIDTLQLENRFFTEIGWHLLEIKDYKQSLAYFKRGAQLYPEDLFIVINVCEKMNNWPHTLWPEGMPP